MSEANSVVVAYQAGGVAAAQGAVNIQRWVPVFRRVYGAAIPPIATYVLAELIRHMGSEQKATLAWMTSVDQYLANYGLSRISDITDTTRSAIGSAISAGIDAGFGTFEISKSLTSLFQGFSNARAKMIARTEVVAASNYGAVTAAQAVNLQLNKQWIATEDDRTRIAHADADGDVVAMNAPFTVDGEALNYPGDGSLGASADNLINCRCTVAFAVAR